MTADGGSRSVAPYGSWPTPITSEIVVSAAVMLSGVAVDGTDVIVGEGRPEEGGRTELVRVSPGGAAADLLGAPRNARTAAHEYGGGAWWARDGVVWFADWDDQRLYRRDPASGTVEPIVPEPAVARGDRYADGDVAPDGASIICVREHHPEGGRGALDVRNEIVRLAADRLSTPEVLVSGPDFVAAPRIAPAGDRIAWIEWDHPSMPWDATRLVVRDLASGEDTLVASGPAESITEPAWEPDGSLTFLSDRTGWWSLYRWTAGGSVLPLVELGADIGVPAWTFGDARYARLDDGRFVFAAAQDGLDRLFVRATDGTITNLELPFTWVGTLRRAGPAAVVLIAATPTSEPEVARVELGEGGGRASVQTVRPARDLSRLGVTPGDVSVPESVSFPSAGGRTAHALLYAPANPAYAAPEGERPPVLVVIHGGPTGAARAHLQLPVQYWTSRGFAVIDVNYTGSTGYGRAYRDALQGAWGIADVEDCLAAVRWLADAGLADPDRLCIRGGSAGGFTTLAALARADTPFAAGASLYGVADLEALAKDTHKFESRYLDGLVGPYPAARSVYRERSPIDHVDSFSRPLIVFQGLEDRVVPPQQSEMIVDALRAKGVPVAYLAFPGEQHGFRRVENIRRTLDGQLSFFAQVLGFALPDEEGVESVAVENLANSDG